MSTVTVYRFNAYDVSSDQMQKSRRWGTREAIVNVARGVVIEDESIEIEVQYIESPNSDMPGFTSRDFNPNPRTGFQRQVN